MTMLKLYLKKINHMAYQFNQTYLSLHEIKLGLNNKKLPLSVLNAKSSTYSVPALIDFYDKGYIQELKNWCKMDSHHEVNYCDYDVVGCTIFTRLIEEGDLDNLKFFYEKEPKFIHLSYQNPQIMSPMISAIVQYQVPILEFLLSIDANLDIQIRKEETLIDIVLKNDLTLLATIQPFFEARHFEKAIAIIKKQIPDHFDKKKLYSVIDILEKNFEKYQLENMIAKPTSQGKNNKI
jgi:hypothetical protein